MRLLILGGTGLAGPHQVRYALARGHQVTVFNRGTKRGSLPEGVEVLHGDRAAGDLDALKGRHWDACIDNPTTLPSWVRDAGRVLAGNVDRYVFISTISVYADPSRPLTETSPLAAYEGPDRYAETIDAIRASGFRLYGPLKAACEAEARAQFGEERTVIIRPGLIAGPGDETDRFTYWPARVARGGEMLAPGDPHDAVQVIDCRDLGEWTVRMAEGGAAGAYNATGPAEPLGFGRMLETLREALASDARFTWVPAEFLAQQGVSPWMDLPAWVPAQGEMGGLLRADISRAKAAGLTFRPLADTARETLAWLRAQPPQRQAKLRAGLSQEREQQVLAAWRGQVPG